ncbi:MAG TPA: aldehyde dehydrogenase family protein [Acidimicrobiales bacterium]|nr:aldehyde dehydrogenase family protein [Acidimicrobiales bacterium]
MALTVLPERDKLGLTHGRLYIDGEWVDGSDGDTWTHLHPATGEDVGTFAVASAADVDRAANAAARAFDDWATMRARERSRLLRRIGDLILDNADELNRLQTLDNSVPLGFSGIYQLGAQMAADIFDHHAGWVDKLTGETIPTYTGAEFFFMTLRQPVGVVGAIIPWNAPLMLFANKVAPALAAGCTVVLKPSEYASFAAIRLAQLVEEAGTPKGVFNFVTGPGPTTGQALIDHPKIDKITFTGSRGVGIRVLHATADRIGRTSLELGGKSPSIVFPDVDLDAVAMTSMGMVSMGLSGQGCVCHTRVLVHESIYDDLVNKTAAMASMATFGNPFDPATTSAPLINARQLERVLGYIDQGKIDGRLVVGGDRPGGDLAAGNFVNPTLFADVDNNAAIAQEEIFGPVLAMLPFKDEADAIRLANETSYGLGASVQTGDVKRALRVAKAVRSGSFGVNGYTVMPNAPFGGYQQSGLGREGGRAGIEEFTELKTVCIALGDSPV